MTDAEPSARRMQLSGWVAFGACVLIVAGALGPWKRVVGTVTTVNGTDNGGDGVYVIILASLVAAAVFSHYLRPATWKAVVGALVAALIVLIAIVDYHELRYGVSDEWRDAVTSGWGIWLVGLAGLVAFLATVTLKTPASDTVRPDRISRTAAAFSLLIPIVGVVYGLRALTERRYRAAVWALVCAALGFAIATGLASLA